MKNIVIHREELPGRLTTDGVLPGDQQAFNDSSQALIEAASALNSDYDKGQPLAHNLSTQLNGLRDKALEKFPDQIKSLTPYLDVGLKPRTVTPGVTVEPKEGR